MDLFDKADRFAKQMENGAQFSDEELLSALGIGATNTLNTAHVLLRQSAPIGAYREDLTDRLVDQFLYPLFYTGFYTPEQVIQWLNFHLNKEPPLAPF